MNCGAWTGRASSEIRVAALALVLWAGVAGAQVPRDSLEARLQRAEAAIAMLQQQIAEASETATQSRSRLRLELHGRALMKGFGNSHRVNNVDNPVFVQEPDPAVANRGVGIAVRETILGLTVTAPEVLGGSFSGDLDVDFYGGQMASPGGRTFPLVRLRTFRGVIRWEHAELMFGQEMPMISPLNPLTSTAFGTPPFSTAGNLWLWLPEVKVRAFTSGRVRFGGEAAVVAPTSAEANTLFSTAYDAAERSQRPYLAARGFALWGEDDARSEVGCSVHQGWLKPAATLESSRAVACDALLGVTDWLEVRGEWFLGQALAGLGGGAIGQNFAPDGTPLHTTGGWVQVNARPGALLQTGAGCGADHPDPIATRRRNDSCAGYLTLRPIGPLLVGGELRRIRTEYASGRYTNDHVTLAIGFEF